MSTEAVQCPSCGAWSGEWCDDSCPTCDQARAGLAAEDRGEPLPPCVLSHPRSDDWPHNRKADR